MIPKRRQGEETEQMTDMPDRYYIGEIIYDELAHNEYIDMNDCQGVADLILGSNWMAAHDAEVVAAARAKWVDDTDEWEYGAIEDSTVGILDPLPFKDRQEAETWVTDVRALDTYENAAVIRRRARGPWQPLP